MKKDKVLTLEGLEKEVEVVGVRNKCLKEDDDCTKYYLMFTERLKTVKLIIPTNVEIKLSEGVFKDFKTSRDKFISVRNPSRLEIEEEKKRREDFNIKLKALYNSFAQWCSDNIDPNVELRIHSGDNFKEMIKNEHSVLKIALPILLVIAAVSAIFAIVGAISGIYWANSENRLRWCELVAQIMGIMDAVFGIAFFTYEFFADRKKQKICKIAEDEGKKKEVNVGNYYEKYVDNSNNHGNIIEPGSCCNFNFNNN